MGEQIVDIDYRHRVSVRPLPNRDRMLWVYSDENREALSMFRSALTAVQFAETSEA